MAMPESREWGQSIQPESVNQNRRRVMQSNLFADPAPVPVSRGPPSHAPAPAPAPASTAPPQAPSVSLAPSPQYSNLVKRSEVPSLSPFPEFSVDVAKINATFDLSLRPRQPPAERPLRRLTFTATDEMKQLRARLERDFADFSMRMKKLESNEPLNLETLKFPVEQQQAHAPPARRTKSNAPEQAAPEKPARKTRSKPAGAPEPPSQPNEPEEPGFTVESTFLLPDGSQYGS
jgi:hypothetical protein